MNKYYKIAVTGFVGAGKTTLCQALAEELALPVIDEGMANIVSTGLHYHQAIKTKVSEDDRRELKKHFVNAYIDWSRNRTSLYQSHNGFVADRCEIDLLNWWLVEFGKGRHGVDKLSNQLLREMRSKIKVFDYLIFMPFVRPYAETGTRNENNLTRTYDYTSHLLYHNLSLGLLRSVGEAPKVIFLPAQITDLNERVAHIKKILFK